MWLEQCLHYILIRGNTTIMGHQVTELAFRNCASFIKCIPKFDGATIDDAKNSNRVMSIYNLIEYSLNYSKTTRNLWFYSIGEAINFNAYIANDNNFKSFKYKAKLLGNTVAQPTPNKAKDFWKCSNPVGLKYLNNF